MTRFPPPNQTMDPPGFYQGRFVRPECRPLALCKGHDTAILMIHGFTGSPADFGSFSQEYFRQDMDVFVPLLPGHGSTLGALDHLGFLELFSPLVSLLNYLRGNYSVIHVLGLSYGAVLAAKLCLTERVQSLCLLAPAFYLDLDSERKMALVRRFRLFQLRRRKPKRNKLPKGVTPYPPNFAYTKVPLFPAAELHAHTQRIRRMIPHLNLPVFHVHGDLDPTTPIERNRAFLARVLPHYSFYKVPNGQHVLSISPEAKTIAKQHLSWIKNKTISSKPKH